MQWTKSNQPRTWKSIFPNNDKVQSLRNQSDVCESQGMALSHVLSSLEGYSMLQTHTFLSLSAGILAMFCFWSLVPGCFYDGEPFHPNLDLFQSQVWHFWFEPPKGVSLYSQRAVLSLIQDCTENEMSLPFLITPQLGREGMVVRQWPRCAWGQGAERWLLCSAHVSFSLGTQIRAWCHPHSGQGFLL